ncbi:Rib/alpha-like domain-containing protein [Corynebacterium suedekumii]|nr:Rib/alpha-like domain-containing protein [Corynebacterium suedekumii]
MPPTACCLQAPRFALGEDAPDWVTDINADTGVITVGPGLDIPAREYTVPVVVTIPGGTTLAIDAPVFVVEAQKAPVYDTAVVNQGDTVTVPTPLSYDGVTSYLLVRHSASIRTPKVFRSGSPSTPTDRSSLNRGTKFRSARTRSRFWCPTLTAPPRSSLPPLPWSATMPPPTRSPLSHRAGPWTPPLQ